jgi:hypothetical protein
MLTVIWTIDPVPSPISIDIIFVIGFWQKLCYLRVCPQAWHHGRLDFTETESGEFLQKIIEHYCVFLHGETFFLMLLKTLERPDIAYSNYLSVFNFESTVLVNNPSGRSYILWFAFLVLQIANVPALLKVTIAIVHTRHHNTIILWRIIISNGPHQ